ncbi:MAG: DUF6596 domain-containing protein [Acidobacteriota bacterium]
MSPDDLAGLFESGGGEIRRRALATLIRLLGDFDLAEETLQDALTVALAQWPRSGAPANPSAWLVAVARRRAIDRLRRARRFTEIEAEGHLSVPALGPTDTDEQDAEWPDDRLRLIFTCCHPALALEAQVALTLRTVCGLSSEEVARAFMMPIATLQQRLVRAKAKIRAAGIPYRIPGSSDLPERLDGVLAVAYLIFNEGYAPTSGDELIRPALCEEAIRLVRLLCELAGASPDYREARALLALLLLQDSRREARLSAAGEVLLLDEQDRRLWSSARIEEGLGLVETALREGPAGAYAIQAAIAALHGRAHAPQDTDWRQIAALYTLLAHRAPSPVVELNRAVAIAMAGDLDRGLLLLEALRASGVLAGYHLLESARADLLRRQGRISEAAEAYRAARALARLAPEQRFLERRLRELEGPGALDGTH